MIYITSKMAAPVTYAFYTQGANKINVVTHEITIKGGADVINKRTLETPSGAVTELSAEDFDRLKLHPLFKQHLEDGFVAVLGTEKEANKADKDLKKDASKQLTPEDYQVKGKKKPKTNK